MTNTEPGYYLIMCVLLFSQQPHESIVIVGETEAESHVAGKLGSRLRSSSDPEPHLSMLLVPRVKTPPGEMVV